MKKILKVLLLALVPAFLIIQLVPVDRTNPPVVSDLDASIEVKSILKRSCYDCHSNETRWPWYSYVAPVSWLVSHDVKEGREELNFSEWGRYASDAEMKEEIVEEIIEGEMPLPIYLVTHSNGSVTEQELEVLKKWSGSSSEKYLEHYDGDSTQGM